jgi:hypothetical protein
MKFLMSSLLILSLCIAPAWGKGKKLSEQFVLKPGAEARVRDEGLKITFVAVTQDSRCPEGATCIWQGNARVHLMAAKSKDECVEFDLNMGVTPTEYEFDGYRVALVQLTPAPSIHGMPKAGDYEATLVVTKDEKK